VIATPRILVGPDASVEKASAAAEGVRHLERLQSLCSESVPVASCERRRGSTWQKPRRRREEQVRQEGVAFREWVAGYGFTRGACADWLGISARTLRDWEERLRCGGATVLARGRPVLRSERAARSGVLELLESLGPGVGLAVVAGQFPDMPKAEIADLLRRYRFLWQQRHPQWLSVLHWQQPGTVWAIDYARAPLPLEEGFGEMLAVRGLASGLQLLWLPVVEATAATTGQHCSRSSHFTERLWCSRWTTARRSWLGRHARCWRSGR
jgi:hypothetical protein